MHANSGRIAFFLPSLIGGGAERVMVNLAQGFVQEGIEIDFVLGRAEGPYLDQVPSGARIVNLKAHRALTSISPLVRYLREVRPIAIISATDHGNIATLWAKDLAKVSTRVVLTLHCDFSAVKAENPRLSKSAILPFLEKIWYKKADKIISVSHGVAEYYSKITGISVGRINVVYNPVLTNELFKKSKEDFEHPWFGETKEPVIISVGRLTYQKNYSLLIQAFAKVREIQPAKLSILGEGELRAELETLAKDLNLADDVEMPGFVANPYKYIVNSSVFVLSSKWEGLPTVLIEALGLGVPVISTDCRSGPSEILVDGKYGRLVPPDDVDFLAQTILDTINNKKPTLDPQALDRFQLKTAVAHYLKIIYET